MDNIDNRDKKVKIQIRRETVSRLHELKALGDTYDTVINRLLNDYLEAEGENKNVKNKRDTENNR